MTARQATTLVHERVPDDTIYTPDYTLPNRDCEEDVEAILSDSRFDLDSLLERID